MVGISVPPCVRWNGSRFSAWDTRCSWQSRTQKKKRRWFHRCLCKKARALVGDYKHSAQATRRPKECQKRMQLPSRGLIQDVDTRWNSEHAMLSRYVEPRDAVSLEIATSETSVSCRSPSEWNVAASLVQILQPIEDATTYLSGQKYGTMSSVIPFLYGTEQILKRYTSIGNEAALFAENLLKSVKSRFPLYADRKELMLATLCDPRC
ncbi:hypothetical protein MTO96_046433 [Rhipicephalus appendiculatus]